MGCSQAKEPRGKQVKSQAQLEYALSNCLDHFHQISSVLQSCHTHIAESLGRDIVENEYCRYYLLALDNPSCDKLLIQQYELLFQAVEKGLHLFPLIKEQCQKFEESLPSKKKDIQLFKTEIANHILFCQGVILPSHALSQSTRVLITD